MYQVLVQYTKQCCMVCQTLGLVHIQSINKFWRPEMCIDYLTNFFTNYNRSHPTQAAVFVRLDSFPIELMTNTKQCR